MPRNTLILTIFLSIFATLVVGANIGRKNTQTEINPSQNISLNPTEIPTPTPESFRYINQNCGILFVFPSKMTVSELPNGDQFINPENPDMYFTLMCEKSIQRPQVDELLIEKLEIGTISAYLYHDIAKQDNSPVEKLIFTHPINKLEIYLGGDKSTFEEILKTVSLL